MVVIKDGYGCGSGSGYGSGYGSGSGSGDGDGDGDGYGSGSGYGDGSGYGSGYGYGSGSGSGYGYGYGCGSGSGDGYGYGSGSGDEFMLKLAAQNAKQDNGVFMFWKSDKDGHPCNRGVKSEPARPGLKQKKEGRLEICNHGFHATVNPWKWNGDRLWIVKLTGEMQEEEDKVCALEREIICEIPMEGWAKK
jgi:hypothetical protein